MYIQPLQPPPSNDSSDNFAPLDDGCNIIKDALLKSYDGNIAWTFLENLLRF